MQEILSKTSIGNRLKDLRLQAGMSQAEISQLLEISRSNYSQIELGNQFPTFEVLCRLASIYSKTYEWLLHGSVNNFKKNGNLKSGYIKGVKDKPAENEVILVAATERNEYIKNFQRPEYIKKQKCISVPFLREPGLFRAFEINGNSMRNALFDGDILISKKIESLEEVKKQCVYVIITAGELVIERVIVSNSASGMIMCLSDADPLERRIIYFSEVKEIWKAEGKYSRVLSRMVEDVSEHIARFESTIAELELEMEKIRNILGRVPSPSK